MKAETERAAVEEGTEPKDVNNQEHTFPGSKVAIQKPFTPKCQRRRMKLCKQIIDWAIQFLLSHNFAHHTKAWKKYLYDAQMQVVVHQIYKNAQETPQIRLQRVGGIATKCLKMIYLFFKQRVSFIREATRKIENAPRNPLWPNLAIRGSRIAQEAPENAPGPLLRFLEA